MTNADESPIGDDVAWNPTVLWSRPETERQGTPLLVLLHGYLANEEDLMGLTSYLPEEFTVVSVRAPLAGGPGYSWFPLSREADYSVDKVAASVGRLAAWLGAVRSAHTSVSLLGFSQGMAVATSLLRHAPEDYACVVGLSGFAVPAEDSAFFQDDDDVAAARVPFFWGRDQEDQVISAEMIDFTHSWLTANAKLTKILYSNMLHSISQQELAHVREFLALTVLGRR
ncbi:alpha/beta hydrolase [Arthrobacter sp. H41]|uniref:alpha/beta hydrolase n=1 Tax=Arthrobacter sp. H41 TaxID=1312978 RepID=UPI00047DA261|nr:phospholipase [Arthrobacter sp. H41]